MARLPIPGSDDGKWGQILNEYLSQSLDESGKLKADSVGAAQIQAGALTKSDIGLENVDNTADVDKPVSTATQAALNEKATTADLTTKLNAADLDAQTATHIADNGSATGAALSASIAKSRIPPRSITGVIPADLAWDHSILPCYPSIKVGRSGSVVGSFGLTPERVFDLKSAARTSPAATYYVNVGGAQTINGVAWGAGSDSNAGTSAAAPFKSANKALLTAQAGAAATTKIYMLAGSYDYNNAWATSTAPLLAQDTAIVAVGGIVTIGPFFLFGTPTPDATYTNCYTITNAGGSTPAIRVLDLTRQDADGVYSELTFVENSLATCNSTPGSFTVVGSHAYVHRADGAAVTEANTMVLRAKHALYNTTGFNLYVGADGVAGSGFRMLGGRGGGLRNEPSTAPAAAKLAVITATSIEYPGGANTGHYDADGLAIGNNWWGATLAHGVTVIGAFKDAFNLHRSTGVSPYSALLTVNCVGLDSGRPNKANVLSSCNGWTLHENSIGVDIAGEYRRSKGGTVHNVNGSKAYMLGTLSTDDAGDVAYLPYSTGIPPTSYKVGDTAKMWLDHCVASGASGTLAYAAASGAAIYQRNSAASGLAASGPVSTY